MQKHHLGDGLHIAGAASYLAQEMVRLIGGWDPTAVMAGLFIFAALALQVMPDAAVALSIALVALK